MVEHLPLVRLIARRIHARIPRHLPVEDLYSAGIVGLMEAFRKFDSSQQVEFRVYAQFRIRGAILDSLRTLDWSPRELRRKGRETERTIGMLTAKLGRAPDEGEVADALQLELAAYQRLLGDLKGLEIVSLNPYGLEEAAEEDALCIPNRPADDPLSRCLLRERQDLLARAVNALPERERRIVTLRYYKEMNIGEIGLVLGLARSRVSKIHASAVSHLRGSLPKLARHAPALY